MTTTTGKSIYRQGVRDGLPFVVVLVPFSALFGVVSAEAGLNVFEALAFSIVVIAGAAQFTALQLLAEEAPTLIVIASSLAVNLRMAMYSASLAPHFGPAPLWQRAFAAYGTVDQSYAMSILKFEEQPDLSTSMKISYFWGVLTPMLPGWYLFTILGAWGGQTVPEEWALDFAVPLMFLAMIGPMLRTPAHMAAAFVSIVAALAFAAVPFNLGLLIAATLAMITGARVELWQEKRAEA